MQDQGSYLPLRLFAWLNLLWVLVAGLIAWLAPAGLPELLRRDDLAFTLLLQAAVSAAILFTGHQLRAGTDLGHKALPAVLVAYGLWLLMALRGL